MNASAEAPSSGPLSGSVSILILTRNESVHIERCLESAFRVTENVYVLDSRSTDDTAERAACLGATVVSGSFATFSEKLNWGLTNIAFTTPWVMRLDADEVFSDALVAELPAIIAETAADVSGIVFRRQLWFMGQWIRRGDMYPTYSMRLWRRGTVTCEVRNLDEHMVLRSGTSVVRDFDIIDDPLRSLADWIVKHNEYSTLEVEATIRARSDLSQLIKPKFFGSLIQRRRWWKDHVFYRLPLFFRPAIYFLYRYVIRLGFLDGKVGFIFHFMHAFWYRALVDGKLLEKTLIERSARTKGARVQTLPR